MVRSLCRARSPPSLLLLARCSHRSARRTPPRRQPPAARHAAREDSLLTPAQLRDCVDQKERLQAQTDDALKDEGGDRRREGRDRPQRHSLADEATTLDRTSEDAVDAYNAKVVERDKLIDTYQARVDRLQRRRPSAVLATKDSYEKSCENRRYDDRDLNDIKRKK